MLPTPMRTMSPMATFMPYQQSGPPPLFHTPAMPPPLFHAPAPSLPIPSPAVVMQPTPAQMQGILVHPPPTIVHTARFLPPPPPPPPSTRVIVQEHHHHHHHRIPTPSPPPPQPAPPPPPPPAPLTVTEITETVRTVRRRPRVATQQAIVEETKPIQVIIVFIIDLMSHLYIYSSRKLPQRKSSWKNHDRTFISKKFKSNVIQYRSRDVKRSSNTLIQSPCLSRHRERP
jgi:hypothetical protein